MWHEEETNTGILLLTKFQILFGFKNFFFFIFQDLNTVFSKSLCHHLGAYLVAKTVKNLPTMQETRVRSLGQEDWKIPWRRDWQPTPVFLPGKSHGQRSLAGYDPHGVAESDTTEWLTLSSQIITHIILVSSGLWQFLSLFLLIITLTVRQSTDQEFCRMSLAVGLSGVFIMIVLFSC